MRLLYIQSSLGSSPHTRGAPTSSAWGGRPAPDHPRIRGEHSRPKWRFDGRGGSSPHTRGALRIRRSRARRTWIIPAYAGSTYSHECELPDSQDHPRIRGEHRPRGFRSAPGSGSSPHTRGALSAPTEFRSTSRIIPAYAGSTYPIRSFRPVDWDHPRIRGEHPWFIDNRGWLAGSSPHTRGAL